VHLLLDTHDLRLSEGTSGDSLLTGPSAIEAHDPHAKEDLQAVIVEHGLLPKSRNLNWHEDVRGRRSVTTQAGVALCRLEAYKATTTHENFMISTSKYSSPAFRAKRKKFALKLPIAPPMLRPSTTKERPNARLLRS
jgi:hypothetical protein